MYFLAFVMGDVSPDAHRSHPHQIELGPVEDHIGIRIIFDHISACIALDADARIISGEWAPPHQFVEALVQTDHIWTAVLAVIAESEI